MWRVSSSALNALFAHRLTRQMRQIVLLHNDLIGSARISESGSTTRHRLLRITRNACGPIGACNSSGIQKAFEKQLSFDEKQAAFFVQWNLTVVWKIQCARVSAKITPRPLFCKTTEGKNRFLHIAGTKKNSDRSSSRTQVSDQAPAVVFDS